MKDVIVIHVPQASRRGVGTQTSLSASPRFLPGPAWVGLFSSRPWQAGVSLPMFPPCSLKPFRLPAPGWAGFLSFNVSDARNPGIV